MAETCDYYFGIGFILGAAISTAILITCFGLHYYLRNWIRYGYQIFKS